MSVAVLTSSQKLEFLGRSSVRLTDTGCWQWLGKKTGSGYGIVYRQWEGVSVGHRLHRLMYELCVGDIPPGWHIDHTCHNGSGCPGGDSCPHRACLNPAHLEAVDGATNVLRGAGTSATNARKTSCIRGHPFDEANTYWQPNGGRACRTCARLQLKERRKINPRRQAVYLGNANSRKTHCPRGHPYDDANTVVQRDGSRLCRACRSEWAKATNARSRARRAEIRRAATDAGLSIKAFMAATAGGA